MSFPSSWRHLPPAARQRLLDMSWLPAQVIPNQILPHIARDDHLNYPLATGPRNAGDIERDEEGTILSVTKDGITKEIVRDEYGVIQGVSMPGKTITFVRDITGAIIGWTVS